MEFQSIGRRRASLGAPQQANLGIDKVRAEFDRQNKAAQRVQDMVAANQKRLIENAGVEGKNRADELKNLESLGTFSKTLAKELIGYQKGVNEREMERGAMKYYDNPPSAEQMAEIDAQEAGLAEAEVAGRAASAKYLADGGAPDIAARMRDLPGWQQVGFVREMLEVGGSDFSSFISANRDTPIPVGSEMMTLAGTTDRVAKDYILRALQQTYMSQYNGINPLYLSKYLFPGMKKATAAFNKEWGDDLTQKLRDQETLDRRKNLYGNMQGGKFQNVLEQMNILEQTLGTLGARKQIAAELWQLRQSGMIKADQYNSLLNTPLQGRKGKIYLRDWVEFREIQVKSTQLFKEDAAQAQTDQRMRERQGDIDFKNWLQQAEEGGMPWETWQPQQRMKMMKDYLARPDTPNTMTESMRDALFRLSPDDEMRDLEIQAHLLTPGAILTPAMVGKSFNLQKKYKEELDASRAAIKAGKDAKTEVQGIISQAYLKSTGEEARNDPNVIFGTRLAMVDYEREYKRARKLGLNELEAHDLAIKKIESNLGTKGEFLKTSEYSRTKFRTTFSETEAEEKIFRAQDFITKQAAAGQNPFRVGIVPGTEDSYNEMVTKIQKGETTGLIPAQYIALAETQPSLTPMDIALQQLKANNPELEWPGSTAFNDFTQDLPRDYQKWLGPKYLQPVTVLRTGLALQAEAIVGDDNPLLQLIRSGEGTWDSANRQTAGDTPGGIPGLENMTLGQWKRLQYTGGGDYFALGAYQFIPETLRGAANRLGITDQTVMTPSIQNRLAMELILGGKKRPALSAYLNGTSDDLEAALAGLSLEWAAVANASGTSSYEGQSGNSASIGADQARKILIEMRRQLQESPYNQPENLTPGLK